MQYYNTTSCTLREDLMELSRSILKSTSRSTLKSTLRSTIYKSLLGLEGAHEGGLQGYL